MELIYQSTIMKRLTKILCAIMIMFSLCQVVGCDKLSNLGRSKTEQEKEKSEEEKPEEKQEEKEEAEEEEMVESEENSAEKQKEKTDRVTLH